MGLSEPISTTFLHNLNLFSKLAPLQNGHLGGYPAGESGMAQHIKEYTLDGEIVTNQIPIPLETSYHEEQRSAILCTNKLLSYLIQGKVFGSESTTFRSFKETIIAQCSESVTLDLEKFSNAISYAILELIDQFANYHADYLPALGAMFLPAAAEGMADVTIAGSKLLYERLNGKRTIPKDIVPDELFSEIREARRGRLYVVACTSMGIARSMLHECYQAIDILLPSMQALPNTETMSRIESTEYRDYLAGIYRDRVLNALRERNNGNLPWE
jgi:hypothetical protein